MASLNTPESIVPLLVVSVAAVVARIAINEQMISIRNSRVEWDKAAGDGFTDTITKGASDHVNSFSRNHGTGSESGSANVDER